VHSRAKLTVAGRGLLVERGWNRDGRRPGYRSGAFGQVLAQAGARHLRTRPYRPQSNGKVERLNHTRNLEWAYASLYTGNQAASMPYPAGCTTPTTTAPTPPWEAAAP
jgi:transposase InsO family protein